MPAASPFTLPRSEFDTLFDALLDHGYDAVGPTLRDGAIVYDHVRRAADLPAGWTDDQSPGRYAVKRRGDEALFGYAASPQAWKKFLHPSTVTLWKARRSGSGFTLEPAEPPPPPLALVGVRPCDVRALALHDRVLSGSEHADPIYVARRATAFVVAVDCTAPGGTCFCASMGTGPHAQDGYDLLLTELLDGDGHRFLVTCGSERGAQLAEALPHRPVTEADRLAASAALERAAQSMGRSLDTEGLRELLYRRYEDAHWDDVGRRCLACGNCTLACPTCFCTTALDRTAVDGEQAQRIRHWDSCFNLDFSYIHGGSVRTSPGARYRQWMTHKLATWHDQFGSSGCVGCGRCITWCPVGIDLTEEARALRRREAQGGER